MSCPDCDRLKRENKELHDRLSEEMYKIAAIDACLNGDKCPKDYRGWSEVAEKAQKVFAEKNKDLVEFVENLKREVEALKETDTNEWKRYALNEIASLKKSLAEAERKLEKYEPKAY